MINTGRFLLVIVFAILTLSSRITIKNFDHFITSRLTYGNPLIREHVFAWKKKVLSNINLDNERLFETLHD